MNKPGLNLDRIRTDYIKGELSAAAVDNNPFSFFEKWLNEAIAAQAMEVNAMVLSTIDEQNKVHSRIVLLKGLEENGSLKFFTNYNSAKAKQLAVCNDVAALFFWKELERQVRIEGKVEKLSAKDSDEYFYSRPLGSRIGAIASPQSEIITDREVLEEKVEELNKLPESAIKRPEGWGGYRIIPDYFEFWQGRHSRLHDRFAFKKNAEKQWEKYRLAP